MQNFLKVLQERTYIARKACPPAWSRRCSVQFDILTAQAKGNKNYISSTDQRYYVGTTGYARVGCTTVEIERIIHMRKNKHDLNPKEGARRNPHLKYILQLDSIHVDYNRSKKRVTLPRIKMEDDLANHSPLLIIESSSMVHHS